MGQYGGTVHSLWVTSQLHIWAIAALLTSPSLVAGCAITPPLPTTRQLLYLEMSRDTSAKNEPRNTPIHVKELVIIYLEIHSPYISKAISRIFSWSIVKCFEPRKCFWDSVHTEYLWNNDPSYRIHMEQWSCMQNTYGLWNNDPACRIHMEQWSCM